MQDRRISRPRELGEQKRVETLRHAGCDRARAAQQALDGQ
jgi:hypothetical protein